MPQCSRIPTEWRVASSGGVFRVFPTHTHIMGKTGKPRHNLPLATVSKMSRRYGPVGGGDVG